MKPQMTSQCLASQAFDAGDPRHRTSETSSL